MKKGLIIFITFICLGISASAQMANIGVITVDLLSDTAHYRVIVPVGLTPMGAQALKRGRNLTCTVYANFSDADKYLEETTQRITLFGTTLFTTNYRDNQYFGRSYLFFTCKNYESAKFLKGWLSEDDFLISCY